jgi:CRP-like cAMP-binding protein
VISKSLFYIIPNSKWKDFIRNALFIWNAEKIKFLQNSPFLELKNKYYIEDIAMNMNEITLYGHLYAKDDEADAVYWVKEGMVELERKLESKHSSILIEYEKMFDQTLTKVENKTIKLIAKRGMLIGVDGLFIKNYSSPNP